MPEARRQSPQRASGSRIHRWRVALLWRSFISPFIWHALRDCGAVTPAKAPNWKKLETVLRHFIENRLPVGGGMFRATTLKNTVCTFAPNGARHLPLYRKQYPSAIASNIRPSAHLPAHARRRRGHARWVDRTRSRRGQARPAAGRRNKQASCK